MHDSQRQSIKSLNSAGRRQLLVNLFQAGIRAVQGQQAVRDCQITYEVQRPTHILSVGKAAVAMLDGLPTDWVTALPCLLVTKQGHLPQTRYGQNVIAVESDHPIPSKRSLRAGAMIRDFVKNLTPSDHLLFLISGGASALAEDLVSDTTLDSLMHLNQTALAQGDDIATLNVKRCAVSRIKGGKLLGQCKVAKVDAIAISDVQGNDINVVGSGLAAASSAFSGIYHSYIAASNAVARAAVAAAASTEGLILRTNVENMYADVRQVANNIAHEVKTGPSGLYIFGGEPTVILPSNPGQGGRNQALSLELAQLFSGQGDVTGLVAGTDGTDGPTIAAGGFFDAHTFHDVDTALTALKSADSASYLAATGDQFITGPTGTNVMDVVIILKAG